MMSSQCIRRTLPVLWIYALIVPISMTLSGTSEVTLPEGCTRYDESHGTSVGAWCEEFTNSGYFVSHIDKLVISGGDHITLGPREFLRRGLHNLTSITIDNIKRGKIDREAFDGLLQLKSISFAFNEKLDIHPDTFQNNTQLNHLSFNQNKDFMDHCNAMNNYLFDAPSINILSFRATDYKCWSASSFAKMGNITDFVVDNMKMIPGIFAPLQKLVNFTIDTKNFSMIKNINELNNLDTLKLRFDNITLDEIQMAGLKSLFLEWTWINNIGRYDLMGVPALEKLILRGTATETIHEDAFSHLTKLKFLRIGGSRISSFTENHIRNNVQLEVLRINENSGFMRLPVFKVNSTLNSSYRIYEFGCSACGLNYMAPGTFDVMPLLKTLDLNRNQLEWMPHGLFKLLSLLESLDLSDNLLSSIPDELFEGAVKLSNLNLRSNRFTTLQLSPFLQTPQLSILTLTFDDWKIQREGNPPRYSISFLEFPFRKEIGRITANQSEAVPNLLRLDRIFHPSFKADEFIEDLNWAFSYNITITYKDAPFSDCNEQVENISCWMEAHENKFGVPLPPVFRRNSIEQDGGDYHPRSFLYYEIYEQLQTFIYCLMLIIYITIIIKFIKSIQRKKRLSDGHLDHERLQKTFTPSEISKETNNYSNNICHVFHIGLPEKELDDSKKNFK